jgi:L-asparaginase
VTIHLLTTGGSIDKTYIALSSSFEVGDPQAVRVLREAGLTEEVVHEEICRRDSLAMTPEDRALVLEAVRRSPHHKILVTHGTDTAAETASALKGVPGKVIVVTGAMKPAAFRDSDAPFNLGFAVAALETLPPGVYMAFHGRIFDPDRVAKNPAKDRFEAR